MTERKLFINLLLFWVLVAVLSACSSVIFAPSDKLYYTPEHYNLEYEQHEITVAPGIELQAWYLPAKSAAIGTIIHLHGNGQNMSAHLSNVSWLPEQGFNVLTYDYRGYGRSQGDPSLQNSKTDLDSIIHWVIDHQGTNNQKLILFGQSLGGALAMEAMAQSRYQSCIDALVVDSSFSDLRRIAQDHLNRFWPTWPLQVPLSLAFAGDFKPMQAVSQLNNLPILFIHGTDDRVVPYYHGQILFEKANKPKALWRIENGRHIDFSRRKEFRGRLVRYLKDLLHRTSKTSCNFIQTTS